VILAVLVQNSASDATDTITASFTFTLPSAGGGSDGTTDTFNVTGSARHDSLVWNNSGQITVNFADGAVLDITLANEDFNGASRLYAGLTRRSLLNSFRVPPIPRIPPQYRSHQRWLCSV
jgi:hypothetical protein